MIFAVNINLESAIDNVPVQLDNIWIYRPNLHWNPYFVFVQFKQTAKGLSVGAGQANT